MCRLGRQLEGREAMDMFAWRPQWLPACGQNADGRCAVQHDVGENRDRVDDVLATVENQKNLLVPKKADQSGGWVTGGQRKLECCSNDGQDKGGIGEGCEVDEADAVSIVGLSGISQR